LTKSAPASTAARQAAEYLLPRIEKYNRRAV